MWLTRARYVELVRQEAAAQALKAELERTLAALDRAEQRADAAVDAALVSRSVAPIAPPRPTPPEQPLFDDNDAELREMMAAMKANPLETLLTQGRGDSHAG